MSARLERLRRAGAARADGSVSRRGALRTLLGIGVVGVAGGVVLRDPATEVGAASAGCARRRPLTGQGDCPDRRVPKRDYEPKVNGCGPQEGVDAVPDNPAGYPFYEPCKQHDICYGTCGSDRGQCDNEFLARMMGVCSGTQVVTGDRAQCLQIAGGYYVAVRRYGTDPHASGQVEGCDCCEDEDEPPPTTDPTSPTTTTPPPTTTTPPPGICAECSCGATFADYGECVANCQTSLGCFTGICHPVECW